jgi:AcrR family transcriptional regulator
MGTGAEGAALVEEDNQHDHGDRDDDPKYDYPAWLAATRSKAGAHARVLFVLGVMRRISHGPLPCGAFRRSRGYRDTLSVSIHRVSTLVVTYTPAVPRLWTETIEAHRREVRDAIQDTTAALVAEHGLRSVTMSQIAEQTDIGRATLYKYFSDVEAILHAWHERQIAGHLNYLAQVRDQSGDAEARLEAVLEAYAVISHETRTHHDTELAAFLHRDEQVGRAQQHLREMVADLLTEAAETGHIRDDVAANELASYCLHALTAASSLGSKAAIRRLVTVTLAGLRPPR